MTVDGFLEGVVGPWGGVFTLTATLGAVMSGKLLLPREVVAMRERLSLAEGRADRFEKLAFELSGLSRHAVGVAREAVEIRRETGA